MSKRISTAYDVYQHVGGDYKKGDRFCASDVQSKMPWVRQGALSGALSKLCDRGYIKAVARITRRGALEYEMVDPAGALELPARATCLGRPAGTKVTTYNRRPVIESAAVDQPKTAEPDPTLDIKLHQLEDHAWQILELVEQINKQRAAEGV